MTYVAAEPEQVAAFQDQTGVLHDTREDAIDANFAHDCRSAINALIKDNVLLHEAPMRPMHDLVMSFIKDNPDMVRVLLGDRDAT